MQQFRIFGCQCPKKLNSKQSSDNISLHNGTLGLADIVGTFSRGPYCAVADTLSVRGSEDPKLPVTGL
jgi:hypothetical protein